MFRVASNELRLLRIPATEGAEFESELLELKPARFRVVRVTADGVEVERIAWLDEAAPSRIRKKARAGESEAGVPDRTARRARRAKVRTA